MGRPPVRTTGFLVPTDEVEAMRSYVLPTGSVRCRRPPRRTRVRLLHLAVPAIALVAAACDEEKLPTAPPSDPALAVASAQSLVFRQISAGHDHTCGLTTDDLAYCWGRNTAGGVGDGSSGNNRHTPVPVSGGLRFQQLSAGSFRTCGITHDRRAYCWGERGVGDGTDARRSTPVPVAGGLLFRTIDAGWHTCGVTYPDNRAYCWGDNGNGKLGDGTTTTRLTPTRVAGGHRFRRVRGGFFHTCGVTTSDEILCWGSDRDGAIGDGPTNETRLQPVRIASTRRFTDVDAGFAHSCGVTTDDRAFCWGDGLDGQVGDRNNLRRFTPKAVVGGHLFDRVTTGAFHTCGEATGNRAWCWGSNVQGQLGDGTTTRRNTPGAVTGGLTFTQVSSGGFHTCGITPGGVGYCWGDNQHGMVGDGTTERRTTPTPVASPS